MKITAKLARRIGEPLVGQAKKVTVIKRNYPPGKLDSDRKHKTSTSEFKTQLKGKQKVRYSYGLKEYQFKSYVKEVLAGKNPVDALFQKLEYRLDNVVFRSGFAKTRQAARQMVTHGHITVNGRRLNIPSYRARKDDVIAIRQQSAGKSPFLTVKETIKEHKEPAWLKVDRILLSTTVVAEPKDTERSFDLQSVLGFYSRS